MMDGREETRDTSIVDPLLTEVRQLIEQARSSVATAVNAGLTMLNWRIGKRIGEEVLGWRRAEYGKGIVASLARQLEEEYGAGFAEKNLRRMIQFASAFPDEQIVVSLMRQLSWTHFLAPTIPPRPAPAVVLDLAGIDDYTGLEEEEPMPLSMTIDCSDTLPVRLHQSRDEFEREARMAMEAKLFELGRLSSGVAASLVGMDRVTFLLSLSRYNVPMIDASEEDIARGLNNA